MSKDEEAGQTPDVIEQCIGGIGRWQYLICIAIVPMRICVAWLQMSFIYLAPTPEFSCTVEEFAKCSKQCPSHVFNRSIFSETIITEWDLVCDRSQLPNVAQMVFVFGILVGNLSFGFLADRYGRRKSLLIANIIQGITGLGAAFSPSFWAFVVLRFFCAAAAGGNLIVEYVLILEIIGKKWRTTVGFLMVIPLNIGHSSVALLAYFIRDWRSLQMTMSIPPIVIMAYYFFLPDSPRWLVTTGRKEQAISLMEKVAKFNKLPTENIANYVNSQKEDETRQRTTGNMKYLVRTPNMRRRSVAFFICWFICGLCFYGLAQTISQIGNIFVNLAVSALMQTPFCLMSCYFVEKFGRVSCAIFLYIVVTICSYTVMFLKEDMAVLASVFGGISFIASSLTFSIMFILASELYPTVVRNVGTGVSSTFSRIGAMLAPFVATLNMYESWLPNAVLGTAAIIAALACMVLPETKGCVLPDTIEDAENFEPKKKGK